LPPLKIATGIINNKEGGLKRLLLILIDELIWLSDIFLRIIYLIKLWK